MEAPVQWHILTMPKSRPDCNNVNLTENYFQWGPSEKKLNEGDRDSEFSRIFRKSLIFYSFVLDEKIFKLSGSNGGFFRKSQMFLPFSRQKNFQVEDIGKENFKNVFQA